MSNNKKFNKLMENLEKKNQEAELNKIICFRSPKDSQNLRSLKKMGLEIDKIIEFTTGESKVIQKFQYNQKNQELTLTFRDGKTVLYKDVPPTVAKDFVDARSAGIFFYENIQEKYESVEI